MLPRLCLKALSLIYSFNLSIYCLAHHVTHACPFFHRHILPHQNPTQPKTPKNQRQINGVFQGSCRVNRLTMLLFSQRFALDPG
ncbi:hypothetical protein, partial [Pseudomonas syringae]|uniref:hypothetical protein n=1 Tax=Pseudomonas syringae TaxID=317 RepID=UPI001E64D6EC